MIFFSLHDLSCGTLSPTKCKANLVPRVSHLTVPWSERDPGNEVGVKQQKSDPKDSTDSIDFIKKNSESPSGRSNNTCFNEPLYEHTKEEGIQTVCRANETVNKSPIPTPLMDQSSGLLIPVLL